MSEEARHDPVFDAAYQRVVTSIRIMEPAGIDPEDDDFQLIADSFSGVGWYLPITHQSYYRYLHTILREVKENPGLATALNSNEIGGTHFVIHFLLAHTTPENMLVLHDIWVNDPSYVAGTSNIFEYLSKKDDLLEEVVQASLWGVDGGNRCGCTFAKFKSSLNASESEEEKIRIIDVYFALFPAIHWWVAFQSDTKISIEESEDSPIGWALHGGFGTRVMLHMVQEFAKRWSSEETTVQGLYISTRDFVLGDSQAQALSILFRAFPKMRCIQFYKGSWTEEGFVRFLGAVGENCQLKEVDLCLPVNTLDLPFDHSSLEDQKETFVGLKHVTTLKLRGSNRIEDKTRPNAMLDLCIRSMAELLQHNCFFLENLDLSSECILDPVVLNLFLSKCKSLRSLSIGWRMCFQSNEGVIWSFQHDCQLQSLTLYGCDLNEPCCRNFVAAFGEIPTMQKLYINHSSRFIVATDVVVDATRHGGLRCLTLCGKMVVGAKGLRQVLRKNYNLEQLDISNMYGWGFDWRVRGKAPKPPKQWERLASLDAVLEDCNTKLTRFDLGEAARSRATSEIHHKILTKIGCNLALNESGYRTRVKRAEITLSKFVDLLCEIKEVASPHPLDETAERCGGEIKLILLFDTLRIAPHIWSISKVG